MSVNISKKIKSHSNSASYVLEGEPIPWSRAGVNFKTRTHYDTQKPLKYVIESRLKDQHGDRPLFEGPLELIITFYMRIPKVGGGRVIPKEGDWHSKKPDWSNLVKFIEDIGNGLLYKDDAQFSRSVVHKVYGIDPRVEFTIRELE